MCPVNVSSPRVTMWTNKQTILGVPLPPSQLYVFCNSRGRASKSGQIPDGAQGCKYYMIAYINNVYMYVYSIASARLISFLSHLQ